MKADFFPLIPLWRKQSMKRRILLLLLAAVLCLTAAVSGADVVLTFEQVATHKTTSSTTLYVLVDGTLQEAQTLPAGTYVIPNGMTVEGHDVMGITYGYELKGYIKTGLVTSALTTITLPSGNKVTVSEALVKSRDALNHWLAMDVGETLDGGTYTDENGVEHELGTEAAETDESDAQAMGDAKWASSMAKAYAKNGRTQTIYRDDAGNMYPVDVTYVGLARSMVKLNGKDQLVDTWRLSWDTEAPEDQVLAIAAPNNDGVVAMRATKNLKSTILTRVKTTRVMQVIKIEKGWTLVDLNDDEHPRGYILTTSLEFYPNEKRDYTAGQIGGCTKDDPVKIRERNTMKSRGVVAFGPKEPLTVLQQVDDEWSEVDIGGYHAFLLNKFIRAAETPVPDAAEAETAEAEAEAAAEAQPTYAPAADAEVLAETARPAEFGDAASVPVPVPVLVLDNDTLADAERAALAGAP